MEKSDNLTFEIQKKGISKKWTDIMERDTFRITGNIMGKKMDRNLKEEGKAPGVSGA